MVIIAFIYDYIPLYGYISHFCYYMCHCLPLILLNLPYLPLFVNICLWLPHKVTYTPVGHIYPYCAHVPTLCIHRHEKLHLLFNYDDMSPLPGHHVAYNALTSQYSVNGPPPPVILKPCAKF